MSVTNPAVQAGRLSQFLAEQAGGLRGAAARGSGEAFAGALEQALLEAGFQPGEFRISTPSNGASQIGGARQVTVTFYDGAPEPSRAAAVEEGFPKYDPQLGPRITRQMWTEALLTEDLPADLLRNVQDPSALLRARVERLHQPTEAKVVSDYDGAQAPINPSFLSTRAQAEAVRERLLGLGFDAGEIEEVEISGGPFRTDWAGEERRMYTINGLNVGLILEKYARYPKELADRMMLDELRALTAA